MLLSSLFERNPGISRVRAALGNADSLFYGAFGGDNSHGGKVLVSTKVLCWKSFPASSWAEFVRRVQLLQPPPNTHEKDSQKWQISKMGGRLGQKKGRVEHSSTTFMLFFSLHAPLSHFGTIVTGNHGLTREVVQDEKSSVTSHERSLSIHTH